MLRLVVSKCVCPYLLKGTLYFVFLWIEKRVYITVLPYYTDSLPHVLLIHERHKEINNEEKILNIYHCFSFSSFFHMESILPVMQEIHGFWWLSYCTRKKVRGQTAD